MQLKVKLGSCVAAVQGQPQLLGPIWSPTHCPRESGALKVRRAWHLAPPCSFSLFPSHPSWAPQEFKVMEDHLGEVGSWVDVKLSSPRAFQKGAKEP